MSTAGPCENATSPIDITKADETCSKICNYKFSYALSDCQLMNQGDYLQIQTSTDNNDITFNNSPYSLKETRLYQPSLHTFNGEHLTAELIIHQISGGNNLLVCIPVTITNGKSASVDFFHAFLPYAPQKKGTKTTVNVTNWSLNNVIPQGKYYFYQGTAPFPPCTGTYNIIVFDKAVAAQVSQDDMAHLTAVVAKNQLSTHAPASGVYSNSTGTITQGVDSNDIYIDCSPVDVEGEVDTVQKVDISIPFTPPSLETIKNNPVTSIVGGILILIIFKKMYDALLEAISG